jgi:type IV secretory pathway VirB2 component (pilin)
VSSELDPSGSNAFSAAVQWLDGLLLGTLASLIAVIAVSSIGLLLLSGRLDIRRAMQVILGCFIIFGASTIATGIVQAVGNTINPSPMQASIAASPIYPTVPARLPPSSPYDPYAGAALPRRR